MKMKLNSNSVTARLYRWFYMNDQMPKSLCPYFWKLLIMWFLLIPYAIVTLPIIVFGVFDRSVDDEFDCGGRLMASGFLWFLVYGVVSMGYSIIVWVFSVKYVESLFVIGSFLWLISIGFAIYHTFGALIARYKNYKWSKSNKQTNRVKSKDSSVVVEFVKGWYKKYCPTIDWYK
jgi:mannose/fructose/N-acetylgalactosamine-specific phosphotransferase system component IIC